MPVTVEVCGRSVVLTYPNKSLEELEANHGISVLKADDRDMTVSVVTKDVAAWLWAGSLRDAGGPLDYEKVVEFLGEASLRDALDLKGKVTQALIPYLPEAKENPPVPAIQQG